MYFLKKIKVKLLLVLFVLSLVSSHYTEQFLIPSLTSLKHLIYYSKSNRFVENENKLYTNYSFINKPVINPVHVAQKAFNSSEKYLFKKYISSELQYLYDPNVNVDKDKILSVADYFINNYKSEEINNMSVVRLPYNFNYPSYDLKNPWYSGMAQGLASVVLLAAYDITTENKYLEMAEKIGLALTIPISEGGTLINLSNNGIWHEEYADSTKELHPKVLNGNIFAIDGIFWLKIITGKSFWNSLLNNSLVGLNDNINRYDGFFWSKYGLMGNYANWKYHSLHILQLKKVINVYSDNSNYEQKNILEYSNVFDNYKNIPFGFTERLFLHSNNMLFIVLSINLLFNFVFYLLMKFSTRLIS